MIEIKYQYIKQIISVKKQLMINKNKKSLMEWYLKIKMKKI